MTLSASTVLPEEAIKCHHATIHTITMSNITKRSHNITDNTVDAISPEAIMSKYLQYISLEGAINIMSLTTARKSTYGGTRIS